MMKHVCQEESGVFEPGLLITTDIPIKDDIVFEN